ncbi:2-C-methyl-D-erythritol 4-phosphate cytidylyltransferase [Paenibacillus sp. PCH8]|uniref:IspD/TarI family cytidylyltransferase n=1 Tax=Paenibacillus sp. PCH8 TaxID=2066524 RepID=UPI000CF99620|nr:IspD/TarI family cytidylyltransferase [Paenibacillus sp. PCH8]PQP84593.1 2-C-methyl-D-erythritol 4-phosphate cytidylyltransferase [Paenibacillus sp. PCH8]
MITAIILAGGTGVRMNSRTKPKQFLELHGKPIIIHTLEHFERHPKVDNIVVVCVKGWNKELENVIKRNYITKVKWVVGGGETVQMSTYNGLKAVYNEMGHLKNHIAIIHDGVRPLIDEKLITDNIETVKNRGSSVTVSYAIETITSVDDDGKILRVENRDKARIAKAPQCFYMDRLMEAHHKAQTEGIHSMIDAASLMNYYGHDLHTVLGSNYNIKITTPADYYIFRALFEAEENSQIFGL